MGIQAKVLLQQRGSKNRLTEKKMEANRFFILSTFLVLMFGFTLSLPPVDVGDEVSEHVSGEGPSRMIRALGSASNDGTPEGSFARFRRDICATCGCCMTARTSCRRVKNCYTNSSGKRTCYWATVCN